MEHRDDKTELDLPGRVIFYDGPCGLCHRFVHFLLKRDRQGRLFFCPQQSERARRFLSSVEETIVYWRLGKTYQRSTAALYAVLDLGGVWRVAGLGFVIPRPIRDLVYNAVARRRFKFFGRDESCSLLTSLDRSRFLD